jgi:hypothetical protein
LDQLYQQYAALGPINISWIFTYNKENIMFKNNKVLSMSGLFALLLISFLSLSNPASANTLAFDLLKSSCPTGSAQSLELDKLKIKIAAAETVDQARDLALAPTDSAIEALNTAGAMLPFSDEFDIAKSRLNQSRMRILTAASQTQVADEFSGIMLAGLDDNAANVGVGKEECHYTTGEVIAIVIGLILGIIPGLILLVLLC